MDNNDQAVVAVRRHGRIRWFRSDRDLWVLDVNKWRKEFIDLGYDVPEFNAAFRFGLHVVDQDNAGEFLEHMRPYELEADDLSRELARRFVTARSWWDVADLFPIMFVDFDRRAAGAFYADGTRMERYVPDGWEGKFVDFATDYPEDIFPAVGKFWVKEGVDLLALLNQRGAEASQG